MNRLKALYDVTRKLDKLLKQPVQPKSREDVITQVNTLIEQRGDFLQKITPPFTDEEKGTGKEIVILNEQIQKQMHLLFNALKQEMKQVKKQKKSNRTYTNPYEKMEVMDGMFMDRKK
jgi:flagellar protein FliT